ncbi:MAG: HxsD-like protein, partial [Candidatus Omnitrophica bacterium]|nr:HxsD-like protein [Candidatus Omnitrophota bacterium]
QGHGMIRRRYHKALYPLAAVQKAARDFSSVARVTILSCGTHYEVRFVPHSKKQPPGLVTGNFSNYMLMLLKTGQAA